MPITISITGRSGTISDFIGGLCSEHLVFAGDALTLPAKVALLDLDGTTLAAADLQADDTGAVFADLSTDTQQVADRYRYQPTDTLNRATIFIGDETTLQAVIPVTVKKNWLDDTAYHPPVAPNIYPTEEELQAWLEQASKLGQEIAAVSGPALESAQKAEQAATLASRYASDAASSSISAAKSYEQSEDARKAALSAAQVAREASESSMLQQQQATAAAGKANGYRQQAANSQRLAERAADDADEARAKAAIAADNAQADAQAAGRKANEASQAAETATAASTSAKAAKTAAETAKTQAEAARDNANAAKTAAEAAQATAESAKAGAEQSATAAASSATNAAASAEEAEAAAEGLQEGLATLNALDGRVTLLENGEGVYKDPSTGKVTTYKPLPGSDGTVKITKELPQFYKILPVEENYATSPENIAVSDGIYYVFYCGTYSACRLYFYSSSMKRLGKIPNSNRNLSLSDSGRIALFTAEDGHLRASGTYTSIYGYSFAMLWDVTAGALLKIVGIKAINANNDGMDTIYNPASGHILTREAAVKREDDATRYDFAFLVWDEDLNPVLDEATGVQKRINANGVFYDKSYPAEEKVGKLYRGWPVRVFQAPFDNKVYFTSTNYNGAGNAGLFTFSADDTPIQIMEHIPVEDPDNPGYCLCEKNEDGSIKREWTDRGCYFPRLVTQEVGPALFMRAYPEEYGLSAGGYGNGVSGPAFLCSMTGYNTTIKEYKSCFRDLAFRYIVTPDNKLINTVFFNNEFLTETKAPRYTYRTPIPNAATIGNKPWPGSQDQDQAMLIPSGYEATAMMFPYEKDETRMMAVRGTTVYDNANPFNPIDVQKYPFCPVAINTIQEGRSASPNVGGAYVIFNKPMWCTTYNLAYAGNFT